ncbi:MAG: hypothetical protein GSR80_000674 [Desulfurococcales archaeon]|nr:hypothetical protein [Desulfurococcales archaeon]
MREHSRDPEEGIPLEALEAAERAAREAIESRLGSRLGDYDIAIRAVTGSEGRLDVSIDVRITASRILPPDLVEAIVDEAIDRARRAFEEVLRQREGRWRGGSRAAAEGRSPR